MENFDFEKWWCSANGADGGYSPVGIAKAAWNAAVECERERCARAAEGIQRPESRHWVPESFYDILRRETAAEIRRRD